jgi:alpha-D-ribose 1-methylphosphonate 5-triphosphate synthase subunit PhnG
VRDEADRLGLREAVARSRAVVDEHLQRCTEAEERAAQLSDAVRKRWQRRTQLSQGRATARAGDELMGGH